MWEARGVGEGNQEKDGGIQKGRESPHYQASSNHPDVESHHHSLCV